MLLGIYFIAVQAHEYIESSFTVADSAYGSAFYIATGFHGLHVIIGTTFLITCLLGHNSTLLIISWLWIQINSMLLTFCWHSLITLDNKFQKFFVSVINMLLIYLFASMKLEKGHKKSLGSSFKIMLHYDILQNRLKYYTKQWFK